MRILIATGIYPPDIGGPATYAKIIADELPKRGHEIKVLVYSRISKPFPKGISHLVFAWKVLKDSRDFDIVLATDTISAGFPVYLASLFSGKPYVLKIGGDYVWEQAFQRWGVGDLLDEFLRRQYGWKIEFMRSLQSFVTKRAHLVITPSKYLALIAKSWGTSESKISVIYNAVPAPSLPRNRSKENILFSAGREVPWKGFKMLKEIEIPGAKMVIGSFPKEEYEKLLASCTVFLLNTGYEGFSHQILEAMSYGLPIITTNVGGNKEIVENEKNALVVEYNNKEAWMRAITRLLNDENLQKKLSENAAAAAQKFLARDMVVETIRVLESILHATENPKI